MDTSAIDRVIDLLVSRHQLTTARATAVIDSAAHRKGVTSADIAAFIWSQTPLPSAA